MQKCYVYRSRLLRCLFLEQNLRASLKGNAFQPLFFISNSKNLCKLFKVIYIHSINWSAGLTLKLFTSFSKEFIQDSVKKIRLKTMHTYLKSKCLLFTFMVPLRKRLRSVFFFSSRFPNENPNQALIDVKKLSNNDRIEKKKPIVSAFVIGIHSKNGN